MHPIQALEQYWHYTAFRPLQEEIINAVLDKHDTFVLLPTGGGKSICYQIPALITPGICIVISPLIALMRDQVQHLKQKGIKAIAITSGLSYNEVDRQLDNCIYGNYKFLYISPERLQQHIVKERIQQMPVNLIAVDEAHCISQWGHDFRPAYSTIATLRQWHPKINCIALTATAKPNVIKDIEQSLDFTDAKRFQGSFNRKNISYQVIETQDKSYELEHILKRYKGSSIIYVRSRSASVEVFKSLKSKGFSVSFFHGGLSSEDKTNRLNQWLENHTQIMVATTAFGMGIDKPNVRTVIHYNLPESLESYYQEAGRAGRDGQDAYAIVLKKTSDENHLKAQFLGSLPKPNEIKYIYRKLCNYFQISYGEGVDTSHYLNFKTFCTTYNLKPTITYNVLQALDRNSIISFNQQFNYKTKIQFLVTNTELFRYIEHHKAHNTIIKILLRTYGGIVDYPTKVNLNLVARKANCTDTYLISVLEVLEHQNIISLQLANSDSEITFIAPREDDKTINPIIPILEQQQRIKAHQIDAVIAYTNDNRTCKNLQLLRYFEEEDFTPCGRCSVCLKHGDKKETIHNLTVHILQKLQQGDYSSRALQQHLVCDTSLLLEALKTLIKNNTITITSKNTYTIL